jgi:hypothetical protein
MGRRGLGVMGRRGLGGRLALVPCAALCCLGCFESRRFIFVDPPDASALAAGSAGTPGSPVPGSAPGAAEPAAPAPSASEGMGAQTPLAPLPGAPDPGAVGAPGVALDAGSGLGAGGVGGSGGVANAVVCPAQTPTLLPGAALFSGVPIGGACPALLDAPYQTSWFTYQDSGDLLSVSAVAPGCTPDSCALHVQGPAAGAAGYGNYGAGVALPLSAANTALDVSSFAGIELVARGTINGTRGPGAVDAPQTLFLKLVTTTDRQGDDFGVYCQVDPSTWTVCRAGLDALAREGFATNVDPATDVFDRQNVLRVELEFRLFRDALGAVPVPVSVALDVGWVRFF